MSKYLINMCHGATVFIDLLLQTKYIFSFNISLSFFIEFENFAIAPVMTVRIEFNAIFNFSIILFFVMLNTTWSLNVNLFAPETELLSNNELFASDQSILPTSFNFWPQDESDMIFGDAPPNDGDDVGESFDLVDCRSSNPSSPFDKSRKRRGDGSARCENPASIALPFDNTSFGASDNPLVLFQLVISLIRDRKQNEACDALTFHVLPFGVCNSGIEAFPSITLLVNIGDSVYSPVDLQHCSLAQRFSTDCPVSEKLYCCQKVYQDRKDKTNFRADVCLSISELMGEPQL